MEQKKAVNQFLLRSGIPFFILLAIQVLLYGIIPRFLENLFISGAFFTIFIPVFYRRVETKTLLLSCFSSAIIFVVLKSTVDILFSSLAETILLQENNLYLAVLGNTLAEICSVLLAFLFSSIVGLKLIHRKFCLKWHWIILVLVLYSILYFLFSYCYYSELYQILNQVSDTSGMLGYLGLLTAPISIWPRILSALTSVFLFTSSALLLEQPELHVNSVP